MKFDFNLFMNRNGLKQQQAADLIGVTQATISNWCKSKTPDYGTIAKLITFGMTARELFGKELGDELVKNSSVDSGLPAAFDTPEFKQGVARAIEDLKKMGVIK